jgi:hypothetical protein
LALAEKSGMRTKNSRGGPTLAHRSSSFGLFKQPKGPSFGCSFFFLFLLSPLYFIYSQAKAWPNKGSGMRKGKIGQRKGS